MNTVIIGLGSNIAPAVNIEKAKAILAQNFQLVAESKFVSTKPIGVSNQPDFLNGAVMIRTSLDPSALKKKLKDIEYDLGRPQTSEKFFGPRTIDLDILVWNDQIVDADVHSRDFVRNAVRELNPQLFF